MKRREFIRRTAYGVGAAWLGSKSWADGLALPSLPRKFSAADTVAIGNTGIKTSRLAMGTGTVGVGHHSHQTALGIKGLSELLLNGYDHGLRFFDSADSYGSHPHVAEALKHVARDKVTVLTKTWEGRVPYGVVGCIVPWNYPLLLNGVQIIQSVVAGNGVVTANATDNGYSGMTIDIIKAAYDQAKQEGRKATLV